uniref:Cathepsin propeptide inhibitor domain-containing protein n=1 Tax=Oryza punctata TaxID=4537 RepID=A0A0E0LIT4_ORYPU
MAKARVNLTVLGLSMVALLVLTAVEDVAVVAQVINYSSMNRDHIPGTPQLNRPGDTTNKYTRGYLAKFAMFYDRKNCENVTLLMDIYHKIINGVLL